MDVSGAFIYYLSTILHFSHDTCYAVFDVVHLHPLDRLCAAFNRAWEIDILLVCSSIDADMYILSV